MPSRRRLHTPNIYNPRPSIPQGYTHSTHATWLPHVCHMASTRSLRAHLLALQVPRPITAHTWPPHGLCTWYTPINRDSDPPAYDSRPGTSALRYLGLYTISHGTGRNPSHYSSRATTALYFSYFIISLQARLGTVATRLCYSFYTQYNTASMYICLCSYSSSSFSIVLCCSTFGVLTHRAS